MKIDGECLMELIGSCRNKFQVSPSVRMPQLNTSLQFHLTPIVMINDLSRCDLLLNSQNFCHSILVGTENPLPSRLCYQRLWGIRNRRAHNLGWTYYLDAFSSYSLRTLLPNIYHGHDNCSRMALMGKQPNPWNILQPQVVKSRHRATALPLGTIGSLRLTFVPVRPVGLAVKLPSFALEGQSPSARGNLCTPPLPFDMPTPHRNCLPETVPWPIGPDTRYPFVKGLSSFSWEYSMGYFNVVVPGPTRGSIGIFTCSPLTMPFSLILGPNSPSVDEPCGGTLGFSGHSIPTNVCVTQADILAFASSTPTHAGKPPRCLYTLPPLSLSDHLGALAGDPEFASIWYHSRGTHQNNALPLDVQSTATPHAFRGELASFEFEWHFSLNDNLSADSSTLVGSDVQLTFAKASVGSLNQATAYDSPTHSSTATRSKPWAPPTTWELTISCSISLPDEVLFTLPLRCYFAIGHLGVFSLARWSLLIHTGFHVPHATRVRA
ncbi:hypothetical protein GOBAR_DD05319 [Gossypium barbadense]|nr:hypothetical protein GOBAR_DD05319 [Gossypium barbadense]